MSLAEPLQWQQTCESFPFSSGTDEQKKKDLENQGCLLFFVVVVRSEPEFYLIQIFLHFCTVALWVLIYWEISHHFYSSARLKIYLQCKGDSCSQQRPLHQTVEPL